MWIGARFVPQLHFDLFSPDWAAEHWLNPWRKRIAKQMLRCAQRVRVVSEALRENVAKECGIPLSRILVAPVGVNFVRASGDKREFKALISPSIAERKVVLFVGRLCAPKNLGLWVDVAQQLAKRHPDVAFVIVGDGPEEGTMRELVRSLGLDDHFFVLGRKMHEELPQIYAAADVFLLTSHYEGFGRVVLESMLSGVPVVSTACMGPEDLVEQGITGYLLPRGDTEGLIRAVSNLLADISKAETMGEAGRARAQAMFSLDTLTERLIDVWAGV
jgi:glycosyltransferase involved in cell wall biosynthesis